MQKKIQLQQSSYRDSLWTYTSWKEVFWTTMRHEIREKKMIYTCNYPIATEIHIAIVCQYVRKIVEIDLSRILSFCSPDCHNLPAVYKFLKFAPLLLLLRLKDNSAVWTWHEFKKTHMNPPWMTYAAHPIVLTREVKSID